MSVLAVTRFEFGKPDGERVTIKVGDSIDNLDLTDEEVQGYIDIGSAIEFSRSPKYRAVQSPVSGTPDTETIERDNLLRKALAGVVDDGGMVEDAPPAAADAASRSGTNTPLTPKGKDEDS